MLAALDLDLELAVLLHPARVVHTTLKCIEVIQARMVVLLVHFGALLGQRQLELCQARLLQRSCVLSHYFIRWIPINL